MNDTPAPVMTPREKRTLAGLMTAAVSMKIVTPFLQNGVAVLLPAMGAEFQCTAAELGLVSAVYCMALAVFNLSMGRAGDKWGRRRVCRLSMVILTPTAAAVALCPGIESVILLRFLQGMGTAAFSTSSLAMLMACSPKAIRGRVLAATSIGVYLGVAAGPVFAGYLNLFLGWRSFFLVISAWAAVSWVIMTVLVREEWTEDPGLPYDWRGFLLFSCGMTALTQGCVGPLPDPVRPWVASGGAVLLLLFLRHEYRCTSTVPLLDVRALGHNRVFVLSCLSAFTMYAAVYSTVFFMSLYLQYAKGMDSGAAGALIFLQAVVQIVLGYPSGWLSDRLGPWPVALAGNLCAVCALGLAVTLDAGSPMWSIIGVILLSGLTLSLYVTPNTILIMGSVDGSRVSQASGMVGTVRTSGMVLSMVIATMCLRHAMGDAPVTPGTADGLIRAMRLSFSVFCGLCCLSLVASFLRKPAGKAAAEKAGS